MTKGISNMLNMPTLEEALREQNANAEPAEPVTPPDEVKIEDTVGRLNELTTRMALLDGTDHSAAMDEIYKEILGHARDLMDYGFNIDSPRARGIFEVASAMYGHAMSAANSKRDAQLKAMRLALDRKKVDLEEKRTNHVIGQQAATLTTDNTIIVEDRNELIRRLRAQKDEE